MLFNAFRNLHIFFLFKFLINLRRLFNAQKDLLWIIYLSVFCFDFRPRTGGNIWTRRLCRNRRRDDNELYRSNSFKFERFERKDGSELGGSETLRKQVGCCFSFIFKILLNNIIVIIIQEKINKKLLNSTQQFNRKWKKKKRTSLMNFISLWKIVLITKKKKCSKAFT